MASERPDERARRERGEIEDCFLQYRASGDREALAKSLTLAQGELRRVARYYALDPSEEDDVVQATVLTAIQRASSFDSERRLIPWLIGILLKKIATARRKAWRVSSEIEIRTDRTPMSSMEASEIRLLVSEALEHLPAPYRDVLTLHLNEGMGGREIAAELHRPQGTIRAQIHRGLRLLREALPAGLSLGLLGLFRRPVAAQAGHSGGAGAPGAAGSVGRSSASGTAATVLRAWVVPTIAIGGVALVGALAWSLFDPGTRVRAAGPSSDARIAGLDAEDATAGAGAVERLSIPAAQTASPETIAAGPALTVRVYARLSGEPVGQVSVRARVETDEGKKLDLRTRTDADGRCSLPIDPARIERVVLEPRHPAFATLTASWNRSRGALLDAELLEIPLHARRAIGGRVVDVQGSPIAGAEVRLATWELVGGALWKLGDEEHLALTDAEGRWVHERAPELGGRIVLRIFHPDYVTDLDVRQPGAPEALWTGRHQIVLEQAGVPVEIVARDASGAPVSDARITLTTTHRSPLRTFERAVDSDGRMRFRWPDVPDLSGLVVSVRAPGRASRHLRLEEPPQAPLEIHMREQTEFVLTLQDEDGRPLVGALVRPFGSAWFEAAEADEQGRFTIGLDPMRSRKIEARLAGVLGTTSIVWTPSSGDVLVVPAPREIHGSLRDAATGAPLAAATLTLFDGSRQIGAREIAAPEAFRLRFWSERPTVFLVAGALGFESTRSPDFHRDADARVWDAALMRMEVLDELVLDSAGHSVDWGEACVVRPGALPVLIDGTLRGGSSGEKKILIRGDGRLALNRPQGPFALAIVTREGFGWVTSAELDAGRGIHVEPWSTLEGHCTLQGQEPETVRLRFDRFAPDADGLGLGMEYVTTTADDGTFRFKGVPPGAVRVVPEARPENAIEAVLPSGRSTRAALR